MILRLVLALVSVAWSLPCITAPPFLTAQLERAHAVNDLGPIPNVPGPYPVAQGTIAKLPNMTSGKPHSASIWYPNVTNTSSGLKFPFLSFAHGADEGSTLPSLEHEYKALLRLVASYGFVIVAPDSCVLMCYDYYHDQLTTITVSRDEPSLHPALAMADFSKVGVFGHSMGAMASLISAGGRSKIDPSLYNINAAVSMHPCGNPVEKPTPETISVPILFTAGSADVVCQDECAEHVYNGVTLANKIFFNGAGYGHMDPCTGGDLHELQVVTYFLTCYLRGEHCDMIYGPTGLAICDQSFKLDKCKTSNATNISH